MITGGAEGGSVGGEVDKGRLEDSSGVDVVHCSPNI